MTIKKAILLLTVVLALIFNACNNSSSSQESTETFDTTKLKTGDAYYQCSMHPEVTSDKPGNCPKCGEMELEKMEKK